MILQDIQIYPVKFGSNILTHNFQTHKYGKILPLIFYNNIQPKLIEEGCLCQCIILKVSYLFNEKIKTKEIFN